MHRRDVSTTPPSRPNASQSYPELVIRWNAMFADRGDRNLAAQQQLHAEMCDPTIDCVTKRTTGNDMHHSRDFVLWHRAFLYYHERLLSALGNSDVGLPYWDWSVNRLCPPAYAAQPFSFGNFLVRSQNGLGDENFSNDQVMSVVAALRSMTPDLAAADLFCEPIHKLVHAHLGWDHPTDLITAAGDPLFYAHHANLDRLATHIFQKGWPTSTGISYHFTAPDNSRICTTVDGFANMASPYEGDQPLDTSLFKVFVVKDLNKMRLGSYSRVRTKLHTPHPLRMGLYQVVSGKGAQLGEIASIDHRGESDFIVWMTVENHQIANDRGVRIVPGNVEANLAHGALVVTKGD